MGKMKRLIITVTLEFPDAIEGPEWDRTIDEVQDQFTDFTTNELDLDLDVEWPMVDVHESEDDDG
jgi:hypothetical protein